MPSSRFSASLITTEAIYYMRGVKTKPKVSVLLKFGSWKNTKASNCQAETVLNRRLKQKINLCQQIFHKLFGSGLLNQNIFPNNFAKI